MVRDIIKSKRQHYWWWPEPLVLPRWSLYTVYSLFAFLGFLLTIDTKTDNDPTTVDAALGPWGWLICLVSLSCLIVSLIPSHPIFETILAATLFCLMFAYIGSAATVLLQGDLDSGQRAIIVLLASAIPASRVASQGDKVIKKWSDRPHNKHRGKS